MNITINNVNIYISSSEILDELKSSDGLLDLRNLLDNAGKTVKGSLEQIIPDNVLAADPEDIKDSETFKVKESKLPPPYNQGQTRTKTESND